MTLAVVSNVTAGTLSLRVSRNIGSEVYTPKGYNTWLQEITSPGSELYETRPRAVFAVLDGRELLGVNARTREEAAAILTPLLGAIAGAVASHPETAFAVTSLDIPQSRLLPLVAERCELYAEALWRQELERLGIPIIELAEIASGMGRAAFYNKRAWYAGSLPFSQAGETALSLEIARVWAAMAGRRKKALALDLDNTLWGGVVGEEGIGGLDLDTTGGGARFCDMQRRIRDLKDQGILLAVISKNNREDALKVLNEHPAMLLRENDFAAIRANWEPKPINLESIANELNIGIDSFVFIDDNPIERETMRIALPQVTVPDFPEDTSRLESFISEVAREHFLVLRTTLEDIDKTQKYREQANRTTSMSAFARVEDYLRSLEMKLAIEPIDEGNLPRAAALTQKTNQFNLTMKRFGESEMREMLNNPAWFVRIGALADKFGDLGRIVLCIAAIEEDKARIEAFLMSCRVMGRGVETTFLKHVEGELAALGVKTLEASYVPTARNGMAADFWRNAGYEVITTEAESVRYAAKLPTQSACDGIIAVVPSKIAGGAA